VVVPPIGEGYRGVEGHTGYLLGQAWHNFRNALDVALRPHGLTVPQYGVLTLVAREPGVSGADLARAYSQTPQAMNGVLTTLQRAGLIERRAHPTHGRILQVTLTDEGSKRLAAATPVVRELEAVIDDGMDPAVKEWLVEAAQRVSRCRTSAT
jgi:DNA-binding MarR family transcriptional regulator